MMDNNDLKESNAKQLDTTDHKETLQAHKQANSSKLTEQQVLIAGGGHVGLSFALLLAHHGIASTLLEKTAIRLLVQTMTASVAII